MVLSYSSQSVVDGSPAEELKRGICRQQPFLSFQWISVSYSITIVSSVVSLTLLRCGHVLHGL